MLLGTITPDKVYKEVLIYTKFICFIVKSVYFYPIIAQNIQQHILTLKAPSQTSI